MPAAWIIPWPICGLLTLVCLANLALGVQPVLFTALLPVFAFGPIAWMLVMMLSRARLVRLLRKSRWNLCPRCEYPLGPASGKDAALVSTVITCPECGARGTLDGIQRHWKGMLGERRSKTGAGFED